MPDRTKKVLSLLLSTVCILFMFGTAVPHFIFADGDKSITLECCRENVILSNMKWRLFRVGERSNGEFVFTGDFSGCYADLKDMSVENISMAAQTIESFSLEKGAVPLAEGTTDENGRLVFSGLSNGLYLAVGFPVKQLPFTYEPSPLLLEVRDDVEDLTFNAFPKIVRATLSEGARGYTVRKVWIDDNDLFEARPTYVTVDLFRNGELYDTVTLNESNNWEHRWYSLDIEYQWRVAERVIPVRYQVRVERNETQFLIRNRYETISDWGEVTRTTKTTTSGTVTTTSFTTAITTSDDVSTDRVTGVNVSQTTVPIRTTGDSLSTASAPPETTSRSDLPQTGQLWWPVLPLVVGGAVLVFIGFLMRSGKDE